MASQWYCRLGGEQFGPYSSTELRRMAESGRVRAEDLVWKHGLQNWIRAGKVRGLVFLAGSRSDTAKLAQEVTARQTESVSVAEPQMNSAPESSADSYDRPLGELAELPILVPEETEVRQQREYKVLTQKDKWFSSKFDPESLERALNSYSQQGWRVRAGDTASIPGLLSTHREEFIAIMERNEGEATYEYKVLTQKDKWYSGKFSPELIEGALNAYASQGWRVAVATTASFPGLLTGFREELVVILERRRNARDGY